MTEIFKAGEHVKIVLSDSLYNEEVGDQTGMVGTITRTPSHGAGVYVKFPHTADEEFYYINSEFVRAGKAPTPAPEPLKVGDWVKVENYTSRWNGTVGHIVDVSGNTVQIKNAEHTQFSLSFPKGKLTLTEAPKPVFKVGDRVEFIESYSNYRIGDAGTVESIDPADRFSDTLLRVTMDGTGSNGTAFVTRFKHSTKTKPVPAARYAVGDWVKVTGYSSAMWEGAKGKVTIVGGWDARDGYTYVIECHEGKPYLSGGFDEKYLKPTPAPRVNMFKAGDWVEIQDCCNMDTCNGTKWEVTEVPATDLRSFYELKSASGNTANYSERNLKATDKPFTPQFKAGDWVEITNWTNNLNGEKVQVKRAPLSDDGFYRFEGKPNSYGFRERYLKATTAPVVHKFKVGDLVTFNEKDNECWQGGKARVVEVKRGSSPYTLEIIEGPPKNVVYTDAGMKVSGKDSFLEAYVEPRWTDAAPVHSSVRIGGRTIVKVAADKWLFLYHDGSYSEEIGSATFRNNEDTANVFGIKPTYALTSPE